MAFGIKLGLEKGSKKDRYKAIKHLYMYPFVEINIVYYPIFPQQNSLQYSHLFHYMPHVDPMGYYHVTQDKWKYVFLVLCREDTE